MKDLFGQTISVEEAREIEAHGKKRRRNTMAKGNAAPRGSGPAGETCGTCANAYCLNYSKRYWKCRLVKATGGPATDIRLKWAACSRWEAKI